MGGIDPSFWAMRECLPMYISRGLDWKQSSLYSNPKWHAGVPSGGSIHCTTVPAPINNLINSVCVVKFAISNMADLAEWERLGELIEKS